ncbi:hypothetical protein [Nocardioides sp.]|uniref:hypothetical protein n=1 Tax=Nocardioides sp. TaxID=35761 RepID=UPI0025E73A51|nr:hypothetical protein [Nocardioides sp.]
MRGEPTAGLVCDHSALRAAEAALASAASELDAVGASVPAGDLADARAVIAVLLASLMETSARLVAEGRALGLGIRVASAGLAATDAEQALRLVEVARR